MRFLPIYKRLDGTPALNLLAGYFSFTSICLYGVITIPVATRFLAPTEIGIWNLITHLSAYLLLLDLGLGNSCARLMAKPLADGRDEAVSRTWSTLVALLAASSAGIAIVGAIAAYALPGMLQVENETAADAKWLACGMVLIHASSFLNKAWSGVLTCQERFHWVLFISGCIPWVQFIIFSICLTSGMGILSYLVAAGAATLVQALWLLTLIRGGPHRISFSVTEINRASAASMLQYSLPMLAWSSAPVILAGVPAWVIGRMSGTEAVAAYTISMRLPQMASMLAMRGFHAYVPRMQNLYLASDRQELSRHFVFSSSLSMVLSAFTLVICILLNRDFVQWLAGNNYDCGIHVTFWICIGFIIGGVCDHLGTLLVISGKPGRIALLLAAEFALTVMLCVYGWRMYGIPGVIAAASITPLAVRVPYLLSTGPRRCAIRAANLYTKPAMTACFSILCLSFAWMNSNEAGYLPRIAVVAITAWGGWLFLKGRAPRSHSHIDI